MVISISGDEALIKKMFLQAGKHIFQIWMQYLNQIKAKCFTDLKLGDFK